MGGGQPYRGLFELNDCETGKSVQPLAPAIAEIFLPLARRPAVRDQYDDGQAMMRPAGETILIWQIYRASSLSNTR